MTKQMSLLDHAMNLIGAFPPERTFDPRSIKPGWTCQSIEWNGCMAERRDEGPIGTIVEVDVRSGPNEPDRYRGILVDYDGIGRRWEPFDYLRRVNGCIEAWH